MFLDDILRVEYFYYHHKVFSDIKDLEEPEMPKATNRICRTKLMQAINCGKEINKTKRKTY